MPALPTVQQARHMICKLLHIFYDLRLEVRTASQLFKFKKQYEEEQHGPAKSSGLFAKPEFLVEQTKSMLNALAGDARGGR